MKLCSIPSKRTQLPLDTFVVYGNKAGPKHLGKVATVQRHNAAKARVYFFDSFNPFPVDKNLVLIMTIRIRST